MKDLIVFHCSATPEGRDLDREDIKKMHLARGWRDIGYHYVIKLDGTLQLGRDLDGDGQSEDEVGAHVAGFNKDSIGICYIGGVDKDGKSKDTRTPQQKDTMKRLVMFFQIRYPKARIVGHRDLSPDKDGDGIVEKSEWLKDCPCFDVHAFVQNECCF